LRFVSQLRGLVLVSLINAYVDNGPVRSRPSLNVFGVVKDIGCVSGEVLDFLGGVPSSVLARRVLLGQKVITFCLFLLKTAYLQ
jgi:hypothetical protein